MMTSEQLAELRRIAEAALALLDEIEQLRAENDRLISDIKMITAPIEVGGGADAYLRYEVDRLRQAVDALQLDRLDLKDVISVLEQEQRRAGRYLEDARDELAHGRIQSAEHRIIDALVSLSSKERRTDTRLKTAVKSGGGCD